MISNWHARASVVIAVNGDADLEVGEAEEKEDRVMHPMNHASEKWLAYTLGIPVERLRSLAARSGSMYRPFYSREKPIRRLNGTLSKTGSPRLIDNPNDELKGVQDSIRISDTVADIRDRH
jgi:hypothetical protein